MGLVRIFQKKPNREQTVPDKVLPRNRVPIDLVPLGLFLTAVFFICIIFAFSDHPPNLPQEVYLLSSKREKLLLYFLFSVLLFHGEVCRQNKSGQPFLLKFSWSYLLSRLLSAMPSLPTIILSDCPKCALGKKFPGPVFH